MSSLTEFSVPADSFLLNRSLQSVPEMHVEIERVVVESRDVTPFFWASGSDFETFEDALAEDPSVEDVRTLDDHDDGRLYQATWRQNYQHVTDAVSDTDATILDAEGGADGWSVQILFPEEDALQSFQEYAAANDVSFVLERLRRSEYPEMLGKYDVTDEQYEALVAAYGRGYFEMPGEISLAELAEALDISKNAASARLRGGYSNIVENTLVHDF
jgi:predicted DNA binding protein